MGLTIVNTNYKERLGTVMKLKAGDVVEFKKYEDMAEDERTKIGKYYFPSSGTVTKVLNNYNFFHIEESPYSFSTKSVARVVSSKKG